MHASTDSVIYQMTDWPSRNHAGRVCIIIVSSLIWSEYSFCSYSKSIPNCPAIVTCTDDSALALCVQILLKGEAETDLSMKVAEKHDFKVLPTPHRIRNIA